MDKDFEKLNRLIQSAKEFFACPECKELAARANGTRRTSSGGMRMK